jgi:hypothetical protein
MIKWLWSLIWGPYCDHEWSVYQEIDVIQDGEIVAIKYILRCTECGTMKSKTL